VAKFMLNLTCDNDAFADDPRPELARILRNIARHIERGEEIRNFQTVRDICGNDVGRFALKPLDYS
jgi:hypothetical protein